MANVAVTGETNNLPNAPTAEHIITAPTNFIRQIASADKVFVRPMAPDPMLKSVRLVLTEKRAKSVIKAVSLLKNDRLADLYYSNCDCENWTLEFYHGTNCLGTATFVDDVVSVDAEYRDETGTLKKIDKEISAKVDKRLSELSKPQTK